MQRLRFTTLAAVCLFGHATAQSSLRFDFTEDGVFPSTDPAVNYAAFTGGPESSFFSVSDGLLEQRFFGVTGSSFYYAGNVPTLTPTSFVLSPSLNTLVETRLKVLNIEGFGAVIEAIDSVNRYTCFFTSAGVSIATPTGFVDIPVDVFDFHTYRLESPGNSDTLEVFVDDVSVFVGTAAAHTNNDFAWGDGGSTVGNGADCDWDFVRLEQTCTAPVQLNLDLDFDQDGVFPSTDPTVNYAAFTGGPESSFFSVSGGLLEQRFFGVTGSSFYYAGNVPTLPPTPFVLSPFLNTLVETRLKVLNIEGFGAVIEAIDSVNRYTCFFTSAGVSIATPTGFVDIPVDVFDFHTYRLESPGNSDTLEVFVDDVSVFVGTAAAHTNNDFAWGDGGSTVGNGADCDWDFVRLRQTCPTPPDNAAPIAVAGSNLSVHAGEVVALDGNNSFDDTSATANLQFSWSLNSTPTGSTAVLANPETATPSFLADLPGTYAIQLVVVDEAGIPSLPDDLEVSSLNMAPAADAGGDQVAVVGTSVFLDGSGTSDPENDMLQYDWEFIEIPSGSSVALVAPDTVSPLFVPDLAGAYRVRLTACDGFAESDDTVSVTVITGTELAEARIQEANDLLAGLPDESFDAKGHRRSSSRKLASVVEMIQEGGTEEAAMHLGKLLTRMDGCELRGAPDPKGGGQEHAADFVVDCAAQMQLYGLLTEALGALVP